MRVSRSAAPWVALALLAVEAVEARPDTSASPASDSVAAGYVPLEMASYAPGGDAGESAVVDSLGAGAPADTLGAKAGAAGAVTPDSSSVDTLAAQAKAVGPAPKSDSAVVDLPEAVVKGRKDAGIGLRRMRSVEGAGIYDGKKSEVIDADESAANAAANNARQIFARVPGVNVWESDGGGLQMGVGARGLSPKRTSEFNTRLNGYDLSADALGYPESYYTPPLEGLDRIEVVRGAASLQYGAQFGGMINFAMKKGPKDRPLQVVSRQTGGSHGFWNSFNSVGGQVGPSNYYAFYQHKQGDDFRPYSEFELDGAYLSQSIALGSKATLSTDLTVMRYLAQQPGGLTDEQFRADPYQSLRKRNWFAVDWNLAAARLEYQVTADALWDTRVFGLSAGRDALGFLVPPDDPDNGEARDLLMDDYRNMGLETRWLQRFLLGQRQAAVLVGARAYMGSLERSQGKGDTGSGPLFRHRFPDSLEGSRHRFPSQNHAVFAEAVIPVSEIVNITPGLRVEYIATKVRGRYNSDIRHPLTGEVLLREEGVDRRERSRLFPLMGLGASAYWDRALEGYANISRNYKAINFNDMRVNYGSGKVVDQNLKDETGFNADLGMRGNVRSVLDYDVSVFYLSYNDRIGTLLRPAPYQTNISDSRNIGLEAFGELDLWRLWRGESARSALTAFLNTTWLDARYVDSRKSSVRNKRVELVPGLLLRAGFQWKRGPVRLAWQTSYTGKQYTEATNAEYITEGIHGAVPAYMVSDASGKVHWKGLVLEGGCDNLFDRTYFSRRADAYPGPGIIPSPGRNLYLTLGVSL